MFLISSGDGGEVVGSDVLKDWWEVFEVDEKDVGMVEEKLGDTSGRAPRILDVDAHKWRAQGPKNSFLTRFLSPEKHDLL